VFLLNVSDIYPWWSWTHESSCWSLAYKMLWGSADIHFWHVYVLGLGYFRMTLVTAQAPHITAHFVTSHRGCGWGDRKIINFIYCCWCRRSLSTMKRVLSVAMEIQFAKYLALLLTTISVQYYEFVSLFGMKNVSCYCNSKLPKTCTWSGTFILKDGRYTFIFFW
jgi:hypothetical protein